MGLTRSEQETIVRWDEEGGAVQIYSASPKTWRRCARLGLPVVKQTATATGTVTGKFFRLPMAQFRWGVKRRAAGTGNPAALAAARAARQRSDTP